MKPNTKRARKALRSQSVRWQTSGSKPLIAPCNFQNWPDPEPKSKMKTTIETLRDISKAADELAEYLIMFQRSSNQICSPLHLQDMVAAFKKEYEIEHTHIFLTETPGTLTVFVMFTANNSLCQCWYGHEVGERAPEYKSCFPMASGGLTT